MTTAIKIVTPIVILFPTDNEDDVDSVVPGVGSIKGSVVSDRDRILCYCCK